MPVCANCKNILEPSSTVRAAFYRKMGFRFGGHEFPIPEPQLCAPCRHQRRLCFRNEQNLYTRTSAVSSKRILSLYHEDSLWGGPYTVMLEDEWRGDTFDPFAYGKDVDFDRPFFEQFAELHKAVPRMSVVNLQNENSPYTSNTGYSKNCYLLPCSEHCEDCYYGRFLQKCKNCVDCTTAWQCELCYECFQISDCYHCAFLSLSENCSDCYFSENLIGCKNCLFCSNLRRVENCIGNVQVSKAEFDETLSRILTSSAAIANARRTWKEARDTRVHRPANIRNCEACTGDFLLDSRNCVNAFDVTASEDCTDLLIGYKVRDCWSSSNIYIDCELNYEMLGCAQIYHCGFGHYVFRSQDVIYSEYIYDSKNLFGCAGLTRAQHCILNKQYSPEDYEVMAKRLAEHMIRTGEWGQTLPPKFSPFGYNETVASDFAPLSREEAVKQGYLWRDISERERPRITVDTPPDSIADATDLVCKEIYRCEATGEPFKLIAQELEFYRSFPVALPRSSPRARHREREQLRFPRAFREAPCRSCGTFVTTNVPRELEATLACEDCYQKLF